PPAALTDQRRVDTVDVWLPAGQSATFALHQCEWDTATAVCSVIKDAGDDPDVTHGAEIRARVSWKDTPGMSIQGGEGVGTVTRVGLGLEVGGPAINPVPRRMIESEVRKELGSRLEQRGVTVEISVPGGDVMARRTLNGRLGITGGISILGTTGIVRPYSTAAWRASVLQAIDVAAANGQRHIVLTTGGRSEGFAQRIIDLPEIAFVEMGIFTGSALERCVRRDVQHVTLGGMIGKLSKTAQGHLQTHVAGNQVDPPFMAELAARSGASADLVKPIRAANTARHVQELVQEAAFRPFFDLVCEEAAHACMAHVNGRLQVDCVMFDFDGVVLGRWVLSNG
ncbi:MAG: cobalt-precorrin-5B (C(1))-methyltransferase, partial [Chloroflexota bacterium]